MHVFGREDSYYKSSLKLESLEYIFGWKLNGSIQWLIHILSIFQGEYYNQDEVQAMVAAEVLAEEKNKKYDEEQMRDDVPQDLTKSISEEAASKKRKRKRPLVAAWYAHAWHLIQPCFWNTQTLSLFWGAENIHKSNVNSIFAFCSRPLDCFQVRNWMSGI